MPSLVFKIIRAWGDNSITFSSIQNYMNQINLSWRCSISRCTRVAHSRPRCIVGSGPGGAWTTSSSVRLSRGSWQTGEMYTHPHARTHARTHTRTRTTSSSVRLSRGSWQTGEMYTHTYACTPAHPHTSSWLTYFTYVASCPQACTSMIRST